MPAHPQLSIAEAEAMVNYILNLKKQPENLTTSGSLKLQQHRQEGTYGYYLLSAAYTDRGGDKAGPLTTRQSIRLQSPLLQAEDYIDHKDTKKERPAGKNDMYLRMKNESSANYGPFHLAGLQSAKVRLQYTGSRMGRLQLRQKDGETYRLLSEIRILPKSSFQKYTFVLPPATDAKQLLELRLLAPDNASALVDWMEFQTK